MLRRLLHDQYVSFPLSINVYRNLYKIVRSNCGKYAESKRWHWTLDMARPSESMGEEYFHQIVMLHPSQEFPWADLVLDGATVRSVDHN